MKSVECLKQNKVDGFEKVRAIKSRRQTPYLQKILTKAEFSQKQVGVFKFPGKRCECCTSLPLCNSCTFKNIDKTFNLRAHFSCNSFNLLYVIICLTCGEKYTGETGVDKTKRLCPSLSATYQATTVSKPQGRRTFENLW